MRFTFILVEPAVAENAGAAARALRTMGFDRLAIVNSRVHLQPEARWLAHGSTDVLDSAIVYDSLEEAVEGEDLVIGTTAKKRRVHADHYFCTELPDIIKSREKLAGKISVVFGREESGLTNEELSLCHIFSVVPMRVSYPSLNLAQAVMIYAWELSGLAQMRSRSPAKGPPGEKFSHLRNMVSRLLDRLGYERKAAFYNRVMERIEMVGDKDAGLLMSVGAKVEEALCYKVSDILNEGETDQVNDTDNCSDKGKGKDKGKDNDKDN